jgi:hypothetical protein
LAGSPLTLEITMFLFSCTKEIKTPEVGKTVGFFVFTAFNTQIPSIRLVVFKTKTVLVLGLPFASTSKDTSLTVHAILSFKERALLRAWYTDSIPLLMEKERVSIKD